MILNLVRTNVRDEVSVRTAADRLYEELLPGRAGWLGAIEGRTGDGLVCTVGLWESGESERASAELPEQQWWADFLRHVDGEPQFRRFPKAEVVLGALTASPEFVQVIEGRVRQPERALAIFRAAMPLLARHRPEIELILLGVAEDGTFTEVVGFTEEDKARAGESTPPPAEALSAAHELRELVTVESYTDVRDVRVHRPS